MVQDHLILIVIDATSQKEAYREVVDTVARRLLNLWVDLVLYAFFPFFKSPNKEKIITVTWENVWETICNVQFIISKKNPDPVTAPYHPLIRGSLLGELT